LPPDRVRVLAHEARPVGGARGVVAYERAVGTGRVVHVGAPIGDVFGKHGYFAIPPDELAARRRLLHHALAGSGERPIFGVQAPRLQVWARRVPDATDGGGLFVFVVHGDDAMTTSVRFADTERLGLDPAARYRVHDILADRDLATATGEELRTTGLALELARWDGRVLRVRAVAR
jgi:hypothetical protein